MTIWQWALYIPVGVVAYIVIGRLFWTLWRNYSTSPDKDNVISGIFWPVLLTLLAIFLILYAGVLVWRLVRFIFTKILFRGADWLGKKAAEALDKLE